MHKDAKEKIISLLEQDSSLTNREIGEKLSLPTTTVHNIVRRLEKSGIIKRYSIVVDRAKMGLPVAAIVSINANFAPQSTGKGTTQEELFLKIRKLAKVDCLYSITGEADIIVKVSLKDTKDLNEFITKIRKLEGVAKTVTSVVLDEPTV